ncbi:MAG: AAA family ATPase [Cyanobacteria bacterium P01_E01_bin.42]
MIREVKIQNYKSIESLDLELGRVNILIGENGCGKTNILEAIALASAAYSDKLDNEFLVSRGIRVTEPQLMRSAFDKENIAKNIRVEIFLSDADSLALTLKNDNQTYSKWRQFNFNKVKDYSQDILGSLIDEMEEYRQEMSNNYRRDIEYLEIQKKEKQKQLRLHSNNFQKDSKECRRLEEQIKTIEKSIKMAENNITQVQQKTSEQILNLKEQKNKQLNSLNKTYQREIETFNKLSFFSYFLVFCPNNSSLRVFEEEGYIQPLGIHGEGLFRFLRFLDMQKDKTRFNEIRERLRLISWFKDFKIPQDLFGTERKIHITDKYLDPDLKYFDQRSSNEGFLFTLFYLALFVGEETSKFFAIDNIDNALNPRLCRRLLQEFIELAKKYDKQTILTTHNPAVLDGLDLDDDEQRLFVVYRNKFGYTKVRRVSKPEAIAGQKPVRLSEAFLRGYIGGLPKNF